VWPRPCDESTLPRMRTLLSLLMTLGLSTGARAARFTDPYNEPDLNEPDPNRSIEPEPWPEETPPEFPPEGEPPPEQPAELAPSEASRKPAERPSPFPQGAIRLGVGGGLLSTNERTDVGFEVGVGYFVVDNFEVGIDGAFQFGDSPFAAHLGPTVRLLFPINDTVAPYVGAFYRHWFVTDDFIEDFDSLGARGGLAIRMGGAFLSIGLVYESIVSQCDGNCSDIYPEFGVSVLF